MNKIHLKVCSLFCWIWFWLLLNLKVVFILASLILYSDSLTLLLQVLHKMKLSPEIVVLSEIWNFHILIIFFWILESEFAWFVSLLFTLSNCTWLLYFFINCCQNAFVFIVKFSFFEFVYFRFDPNRFSDEALKSSSSPTAFQPFAFADKRTRLASDRIQLYASIHLVYVLRKFRLSLVKGQVVTPVYGLVTHPDDEIWITAAKLHKSWL